MAHSLCYELVSDTVDMYRTILMHRELEFFNDIPADIYAHADDNLLGCVVRNPETHAAFV
jgi:hypothetical protein